MQLFGPLLLGIALPAPTLETQAGKIFVPNCTQGHREGTEQSRAMHLLNLFYSTKTDSL
jgi:hypothetical protein